VETNRADPFFERDATGWQSEYLAVAGAGEKLFHGGLPGKNTVSCDQCHPIAGNVHPESYPGFQQQPGKVAVLGEMINWCIRKPQESESLALDDADMVALQAIFCRNAGVTRWPRGSTDPAVTAALTGFPAMPCRPVGGADRVARQQEPAVYPDVRIDIAVVLVRKCHILRGILSPPLW